MNFKLCLCVAAAIMCAWVRGYEQQPRQNYNVLVYKVVHFNWLTILQPGYRPRQETTPGVPQVASNDIGNRIGTLDNTHTVPEVPAEPAVSYIPQYKMANSALMKMVSIMHNQTKDDGPAPRNNIVLSPFSMGVAVAQISLGMGNSSTRDILGDLLGVKTDRQVRVVNAQLSGILKNFEGDKQQFRLNTANAIFAEPELRIHDRYKDDVTRLYKTDVIPVTFTSDPARAVDEINAWTRKNTGGLIQSLLTSVPRNVAAIMANTIFFQADWLDPFSYQLTRDSVFYTTASTTVNTTFMQGQFDEVLYAENPNIGAKLLRFPYKGEAVNMFMILPDKNVDIDNILPSLLNQQFLDEFIASATPHTINLSMPKLNLRNTIHLKNVIRRLRKQNSRQYADNSEVSFVMNKASDDPNFVVSDIVQQVAVQVDEKGTTASAATAGIIDYDGSTKNFRLNKPYVFFIRHELTKAILFWGTIYNPNLV